MLGHIGNRVGGRIHVQGQKDLLAHELLPGFPRFQFDDVTGGSVHQVVVQEGFPHRLLRLEVLQLFEQLLPRKRRLEPDQIMPRHSGTVRQHVAQSDVVVQLIVVKLDCRNGLTYRLIPSQLSFFDQHACGHSGEQFGVRGDLAQRRWREGQLLLVVSIAIALGENQFVIDHNSYANPGCIPILQNLDHVGVEVAQLTGDLGRLRASARHTGHHLQHQGEE